MDKNRDENRNRKENEIKEARISRIMEGLATVSGIPVRIVQGTEALPHPWQELVKHSGSPDRANNANTGRASRNDSSDRANSAKGVKPVLYTKDLKSFWALIRIDCGSGAEESFCLSGPISIRPLTEGQLKRFYNDYGIVPGAGESAYGNPHVIPFRTFLTLVITEGAVLGFDWDIPTLMETNHLPEILLEDSSRREQILFEMAAEQEEIAHHSYEEERYLLQCVREGKTEEALRQNAAMDLQMGRMSRKETDQWRKTVTVAVTLCSRAAIEGGVAPARVYQISDYYLQKSDGCRTPKELTDCRNQAVRELSNLVHARNSHLRTSSYVEKCKDYVRKNYKHKIYVVDIADALGISETYLSKLFSRETGQRLQDYISQVRVDKAANLLIYSEESIADIAEYCCFPSQSYFGHVFLKFKGMSPNRFRERYKPAEFSAR